MNEQQTLLTTIRRHKGRSIPQALLYECSILPYLSPDIVATLNLNTEGKRHLAWSVVGRDLHVECLARVSEILGNEHGALLTDE